jgi:hypothetical protein
MHDGNRYGWGGNAAKQSCPSTADTVVTLPCLIDIDSTPVKKAVAYVTATMALTTGGDVYFFGSDSFYIKSGFYYNSDPSPTKTELPSEVGETAGTIADVAWGGSSVSPLAYFESGEIYHWNHMYHPWGLWSYAVQEIAGTVPVQFAAGNSHYISRISMSSRHEVSMFCHALIN